MPSIFSKIVSGEIPAYKVAEDDRFLAFLDVVPVAKGHTLVIPKKEIDYIFDLSADDLADIHKFAQRVAVQLKRAIPCVKVGVAVVGLEVPHAHIHLIPMQTMADFSFAKERLKFGAEEMQSIAESIRIA
jgi:histidine triad (HIT) family protein